MLETGERRGFNIEKKFAKVCSQLSYPPLIKRRKIIEGKNNCLETMSKSIKNGQLG